MADLIELIEHLKADPISLVMTVGIGLMLIGSIVQIGTSKAERYGKVQTDPKTKMRIRIGYGLMSAGLLVIIVGFVILDKLKLF